MCDYSRRTNTNRSPVGSSIPYGASAVCDTAEPGQAAIDLLYGKDVVM